MEPTCLELHHMLRLAFIVFSLFLNQRVQLRAAVKPAWKLGAVRVPVHSPLTQSTGNRKAFSQTVNGPYPHLFTNTEIAFPTEVS